jgi:hypothetical protein
MASSDGHNAENFSNNKVPPMKERSTNEDAYPPAEAASAAVTASTHHPSNFGEALAKKRSVSFEEQRKPRITGANMAATSNTRDHAGARDDRGDSSADERTGILGRARDGNRDYRTAGATSSNNTNSADGGGGGGKVTRTSATQNSEGEGQAQPGWLRRQKGKRRQGDEHRAQEKAGGWWGALLEKYGSVELENKGSVARDHLALGTSYITVPNSTTAAWQLTILAKYRAHISCLAPNLPLFRLHRHCRHPTLSSQHITTRR